MPIMFDLEARYDSRKSFYGKAKVTEEEDGSLSLYSYNTKVATIKGGKLEKLDYADYSMTTRRHVREFERQFATA